MGRIHNLNRKVGRMGLLNLLYLTSMPTEHKNKYFVKPIKNLVNRVFRVLCMKLILYIKCLL